MTDFIDWLLPQVVDLSHQLALIQHLLSAYHHTVLYTVHGVLFQRVPGTSHTLLTLRAKERDHKSGASSANDSVYYVKEQAPHFRRSIEIEHLTE